MLHNFINSSKWAIRYHNSQIHTMMDSRVTTRTRAWSMMRYQLERILTIWLVKLTTILWTPRKAIFRNLSLWTWMMIWARLLTEVHSLLEVCPSNNNKMQDHRAWVQICFKSTIGVWVKNNSQFLMDQLHRANLPLMIGLRDLLNLLLTTDPEQHNSKSTQVLTLQANFRWTKDQLVQKCSLSTIDQAPLNFR